MHITVIARKENSIFETKEMADMFDGDITSLDIVPCEEQSIYNAIKELLLQRMENKHIVKSFCEKEGYVFNLEELPEDFANQAFSYICDRMAPELVLVENVNELCEIANDEVIAAFNGLFFIMAYYNTYLVGFYDNRDMSRNEEHQIHRIIKQGGTALLFGGCFDRQKIIDADFKINDITRTIDYNQGFMKYRGELYPIMMPCGELIKEKIDEDDLPIFQMG